VRLSGVGDDAELADFCRAAWPRLVGSLGLYVGDRALAEDLAQETLVRVCTHWKQVRDADSPSAWAHRVAFNLAKSHHRREATWRRLRPRAIASVEIVHTDGAVALAIRDAVASLPEPQRQALVLRYFADLSVRDTALVMNCQQNTVKTHTRRALERLRERGLLETDDDDDSNERAQEATP
jgi:RNA polymerase sigma factor (sigma-70 family)